MSLRVEIIVDEIAPSSTVVLDRLGFPTETAPNDRHGSLLRTAQGLFATHAAPAGLLAEIGIDEFARVYRGAGMNEPQAPLEEIYPRADRLAVFAVTLGQAVSAKITELFVSRDFALASVLDTVASEGTENAGDVVQRAFHDLLVRRGEASPSWRLLRYSPGYCGWHMSGQQALFAVLEPERIGIALRESLLMQPLKSMTGVIIAGPGEIHDFEDTYPFCRECLTHSCRERIRQVLHGARAQGAGEQASTTDEG